MFLKIKEKLHKFLFPDHHKTIGNLNVAVSMTVDTLNKERETFKKQLESLQKEVQDELEKKPSMADLMRESLGLYTMNITDVDEDGLPKHFLNTDDKDKRNMYIAQLAQIQQLEVWPIMCQNHIDTQGNFIVRNADGELQMLSGRMTINGISLLKHEVKKGFEEYQEGRKPSEDFDPDETTEGIIINNLIEKNEHKN